MLHGKCGENLYDPRFWFTETPLGTKIKLTVLVDDLVNAPYKAHIDVIVGPGMLASFGPTIYGTVCSELLNQIMTTDLIPPEPCECQSREWLEAHPGDEQEYWRTRDGRVYAKDHTNMCPKNPKNRKNDD